MRGYFLALSFAVAVLAFSHPAWAKKAFVSDSITIPLYEEPDIAKEILVKLRSGQRLETLETRDEWTRVRVLEGEGEGLQGWILSSYLSSRQPWEKRAMSLKEENIKLKARLDTLEAELNDLSVKKLGLKKELQELTNTLELLKKEYTELEGGGEGYRGLETKFEKLKEILDSGRRDVQHLREENTRLKTREKTRWLLLGALILLCGLMLGLIIGRQHKKRRPGGYF
ncbi:MAG: TIGR04211 family SH3 domain-containing protein [Deltaproteobacteria bacterium]|nr:TIGR04211 family SH3 domain-containing protein [Deltaproteobacteria bacterium]